MIGHTTSHPNYRSYPAVHQYGASHPPQSIPAMTTTTTTPTATYISEQRYHPPGSTLVGNFSYGIPTLYNPAQVPTFEGPIVVNIPVSRYRNWWTEATTAERKYVSDVEN